SPPGEVVRRSLVVAGDTREYLLYIPSAYDGSEAWPLVFNFHGHQSNAANQMNTHSKMNIIADTAHFLVAYPEGKQVNFPGFGTAPGWVVPSVTAVDGQNDLAFVGRMLTDIQDTVNVDEGRIHATGWSNGCMFAFYVGCQFEEIFASVGGVSGPMTVGMPDACRGSRPLSTLLIHGTADPVVPFTGIPNLVLPVPETPSFFAARNNCSRDSILTFLPDVDSTDQSTVTLIEYPNCQGGHLDPAIETVFYRVENGGHAWPGTAPDFLGNTNYDINGSEEIWHFFKRNPYPVIIPPGQVHQRSFVQDDSLREYLLYVPEGYTGTEPWPLVINYHGFSIDAATQMDYTNMNATADSAHFLVAYPDGQEVEDIVFGSFGKGWYIPGSYRAAHDDVAFTESMIDHINADFPLDNARIHATGWSNGGEFAYHLACMLPERIASVASVSNAMTRMSLDSCQAGRPFSTMLIHGTNDPFFPWEGDSVYFPSPPVTIAHWLANNHCPTDPIVTELPDRVNTDSSTVTLFEYLDCDSATMVLLYRINNGGHTWPGSVPRPAWSWLKATNQDIDANAEIWDFFERNPHPDSSVGINDGVTTV
ncbi:MAG TPA: PHB depolymerase family esterase, partial [Calditrichia bacterium]|nr:PHB depolymerase family esterase [Calditrichia bacterium]